MKYYVSWSPMNGEATYTRCFENEEIRDRFAKGLSAKSIHTWTK